MLNPGQSLIQTSQYSWVDKLARSAFLKVLSRLPEGYLVIKEHNELVEAFGDPHSTLRAEVNILDGRAYRQLLFGGSIASGETFADNLWDTPDLTSVIRIFARNLPTLDAWEEKLRWLATPIRKLSHIKRRNSPQQAKRNIAAHYDLGNKLYGRFLDENMVYSAAIYPQPDMTLDEAQRYKLDAICSKLNLTQQDHLLEIGTGWGGLAIHAAKHYGCKVTTTTISEEQYAYAKRWIEAEKLDDKITLLKQDYRQLEGEYDKLVSIEMIEAVGQSYLPTFFDKCTRLLKDSGLMLLQSITIDDRRFDSYSKDVDFIQQYIFPGGFLPSQLQINQHLKQYTNLMIRDLHDIGLDYALTIKHWHQRFIGNIDELRKHGYDDRFERMWRYYLSYCEGGFLERTISAVQLVLSKPAYRLPVNR